MKMLRLLLTHGALNDVAADMRDIEGRTLLMLGILAQDMEWVKTLLQSGAQVNTADKAGETALMLAAKAEQSDLVRLLLDRGAQVIVRDNEGKSALMVAAKAKQLDAARLLLARGAQVNARDKPVMKPIPSSPAWWCNSSKQAQRNDAPKLPAASKMRASDMYDYVCPATAYFFQSVYGLTKQRPLFYTTFHRL